jgi:hypothetical protein
MTDTSINAQALNHLGVPVNQTPAVPQDKFVPEELSSITRSISADRSETRAYLEVLELYRLGFNVFPIIYGQKSGGVWKYVQFTRLRRKGLRRVFSGRFNVAIMCGKTSGNLFVIDCETPEALAYHINQLKKRNIPLWVVKTARGGHIYLFCADGEVKNVKDAIQDAEIRGRNCYVLCPPSLHPAGVFYEWLLQEGERPPTVHVSEIDWLVDKEGNPIKLKARKPRKLKPDSPIVQHAERVMRQLGLSADQRIYQLTHKTLDYLESGHSIPEKSRNTRLFAAACDMVAWGFDRSEVEQHLMPLASASGLEHGGIVHTLHSATSKPRTSPRSRTGQTFSPRPLDWQYAQAYVDMVDWSGATGSTDRAVAMALVVRTKLGSNERGVFRATYRELNQLSRRSNRNTIARSLERLQGREFIRKAGNDRDTGASQWRFTEKVLEQGRDFLEAGVVKSEPSYLGQVVGYTNGSLFNTLPTDAAERGALGVEGLLVYHAMIEFNRPIHPKALALRTSLNPGQVRYRLRQLKKYSLVKHTLDGWIVEKVLDTQGLDEQVAQPAGKLGKGSQRQRTIAEDRAQWAGTQIMIWRERNDPNFTLVSRWCSDCGKHAWSDLSRTQVCTRCGGSSFRSEKPEQNKAGGQAEENITE